jgi:hypothetical protein
MQPGLLAALGLLLVSLCALAGCLEPPPPDDPRGWNHATWCGTNPPSGYCIVPESSR